MFSNTEEMWLLGNTENTHMVARQYGDETSHKKLHNKNESTKCYISMIKN